MRRHGSWEWWTENLLETRSPSRSRSSLSSWEAEREDIITIFTRPHFQGTRINRKYKSNKFSHNNKIISICSLSILLLVILLSRNKSFVNQVNWIPITYILWNELLSSRVTSMQWKGNTFYICYQFWPLLFDERDRAVVDVAQLCSVLQLGQDVLLRVHQQLVGRLDLFRRINLIENKEVTGASLIQQKVQINFTKPWMFVV